MAAEIERLHSKHTFRFLLAVSDVAETELLLPLAEAVVADRHEAELTVMHVVTVPDGESLSEGTLQARQARDQLHQFLRENEGSTTPVKTIVHVGYEIWPEIWEVVEQEGIDTLMVGWGSTTGPRSAIAQVGDLRLSDPPCDLIAVRLGEDVSAKDWLQQVRRILMPVRRDPGDSVLMRTTSALAEAADATITVLHATGRDSYHAIPDWYIPPSFSPGGMPRLERFIVRTGSAPTAILEEAQGCHLVVMGTTKWPVDSRDWRGPVVNAVLSDSKCSLVTIRESTRIPLPRVVQEILKKEEKSSLSETVDKWFAENTYHSDEFANVEQLLALKEEQGLTISLGLPALNEEKTVGGVIKSVKSELMDRVPLLDEIVLIDSNSRDHTREVAAGLGIPVYVHQDILPQQGRRRGKGEALWKSLYVLQGDILAWIDTDIVNADPRFVYGVIGPLLHDPNLQYVKGFYHRPILENGKLRPGGGGRVTELTCRPLFNLFFAELSGLIQPLSGEYAGRRSALEQLPFFCGYGVETGLLIDMLERHGLNAIAQVDLLERVHRNQGLLSLSKMSFAVIQVVTRRLEGRHSVRLMKELDKTMKLAVYMEDRYSLEEEEIRELERPPMIEIPEYRRKRVVGSIERGERASA